MNRDRALGTCLGAAAGDAAGTVLEFSHPTGIKPFPELNLGPITDIVGGGPFRVKPGQVTDDTHLGAAIAASLTQYKGFSPEDILKRYVHWRGVTFDIGGTTSSGISMSKQHGAQYGGYHVWKSRGDSCAANGSLMRTYPLGVWFHANSEACMIASMQESGITHGHPLCLAACAAFNAAIAAAVHLDNLPIAGMVSAANTALDEMQDQPHRFLIPAFGEEIAKELHLPLRKAAHILQLDLEAAEQAVDPLKTRRLDMYATQGYVRVAWTLAWWALLTAPDFRSGALAITNLGGDSDTNGAIAGALLGAYHGAEGIPHAWRERVLSALQNGEHSPFRDEYHPKVFLPFIESLPK